MEADGYPGSRRIIGRTLLRIGREEDNDIRFAVKTVHRYHAVIRRTTDGVVMITDVSGKDGNGVLVNGARVAEARLRKATSSTWARSGCASTRGPSNAPEGRRSRSGSNNEMNRFRTMIFGRFAMSNERADTTETTKPHQGSESGPVPRLAQGGARRRRPRRHAARNKDANRSGVCGTAGRKAGRRPTNSRVPTVSEPPRKDAPAAPAAGAGLSAAEAAREVKGQTSLKPQDSHLEFAAPPTTRVVRGGGKAPEDSGRTRLVRGKVEVQRGEFEQDPVVGWLVVVGGPGIGCYRPIFEGNNTLGRSPNQRIPLDFGDDTISSEEQAYIRYDSAARSFLFVPNLAKTNVVSVNDKRPTGAVELNQMDVITVGRTQLVFVPFCGAEFDWAELTDAKS